MLIILVTNQPHPPHIPTDDAVSFSESQLSESEADDALGALSRDELLASLLDDTIIEDVAAKIEGFDDDFQEPEDEQVCYHRDSYISILCI